MKDQLIILLVFVGIFYRPVSVIGQVSPVDSIFITASYENQPLVEVLAELKQDVGVDLFYQTTSIPSQNISLKFENAPLSEVLEHILRNSNLGYIPYRNYGVVIVRKAIIAENYSANYYQALEKAKNSNENNATKKRKISVGDISQLQPSGKAVIKGVIKDAKSKEPIIGATIFFTEISEGFSTDFEGKFEAEVPIGEHEIRLQYIGYETTIKKIEVFSNGPIELELFESAINLKEVIVRAQAVDDNVENIQIGKTTLEVKSIKKIPALFGEADVVRALLLNPGVSTIGEGATGFNVRGGSVDQNLVLQDEGFIFNTSHALGFFSTFNPDLIKSVDLYKGNIPAEFGGRLASVLDVQMRDGNFEQFKIKGSGGPVSSKISVEGPVIEGKSSFLVGGRSTYAGWFLKNINVKKVQNSSAFFYDLNLRYTHRINNKNTIVFSAYSSFDNFVYNQQFGFDYQTLMGQMSYSTIINEKISNKLSLVASSYKNTQTNFEESIASILDNELSYLKLKNKLTFAPQKELTLSAGFALVYYFTEPGAINPLGELSIIAPKNLEQEKGLESTAFFNVDYEVSSALALSGGLRLTLYNFLGPKTINRYINDDNSNIGNLVGSQELKGVLATYGSIEPRFSLRYRIDQAASIKAGYSRTAQYINQIFNTATPTPTSQYQLSTIYIKPQRSHNASIGYFKNFNDNLWETSVELYARTIDQTFDYKDFADLNVNPFLETELINGIGRTAGLELSIRKKNGIVNGFLSYTLSKTELKIDGINDNEWYPNNFDKPHDLSLVLNFNRNQRHTFTLNFNYSTGRPTTPPFGTYRTEEGLFVPLYLERNAARIPDYHRLDFAYTLGKGYKKTNKFKTSWTLSIYNVYGRKNAFSVFYNRDGQANKFAILGAPFPALTFNMEIL